MKINFTGHHIEITPALRAFTEEKFSKLKRHYGRITAINVIFDVEKLRHVAEANLLIVKETINASSEAGDLYSAIDKLAEKLDRQLLRNKEKMQHHRSYGIELDDLEE